MEKESLGPCPLCGGEAEKKFTDVELWMRDNILFIGDEIPEGIAADLRNKFVLLGMPQLLIDVAEKELSALAAQNRRRNLEWSALLKLIEWHGGGRIIDDIDDDNENWKKCMGWAEEDRRKRSV